MTTQFHTKIEKKISRDEFWSDKQKNKQAKKNRKTVKQIESTSLNPYFEGPLLPKKQLTTHKNSFIYDHWLIFQETYS